MANFPYLGHWGMTDESDYRSILRVYDDGSYREYRKSTFKHRIVTIPFKGISKTKRDAIEAFYNTNRFIDITLYVWPEATVVGTGTSHTARIVGALLFTNQSNCRYDTQVTFRLLN
jgi:hypothetical protein